MFVGGEDLAIEKQQALQSVAEHVTTVDILNFFDEDIVRLQGGGWAIKPFAMLASSFEQVIIADADVVFLQPPDTVFDHPGFSATGTLFFHDRVVPDDSDMHTWWQNIMRDRAPSLMLQQSQFWTQHTNHEMESGVVVLHKGSMQVLLGLLFTSWMNTKTIRDLATYRYTQGETLHAIAALQSCMAIPLCTLQSLPING